MRLYFTTPEDTVIAKLVWFRKTGEQSELVWFAKTEESSAK